MTVWIMPFSILLYRIAIHSFPPHFITGTNMHSPFIHLQLLSHVIARSLMLFDILPTVNSSLYAQCRSFEHLFSVLGLLQRPHIAIQNHHKKFAYIKTLLKLRKPNLASYLQHINSIFRYEWIWTSFHYLYESQSVLNYTQTCSTKIWCKVNLNRPSGIYVW